MPIEKSFVIFGGDVVDIVVSSATTGGQYSVITEIVQPQVGPPPHVHTLEDEFLMPLYGEFETFDGTSWKPMPKEGIHCPRNTLHTFRNPTDQPAKIFVVTTGSSFDVFIEKLAPLQLPRDLQQLIDISAEHGITYQFPPAPDHIAAPV
jgi:quercetin dioxygenase-like cupin family protein